MKKRIVSILFWGIVLTQTADFSSLYRGWHSLDIPDMAPMQLALAEHSGDLSFQGAGFQILETQRIKRVTPPVVPSAVPTVPAVRQTPYQGIKRRPFFPSRKVKKTTVSPLKSPLPEPISPVAIIPQSDPAPLLVPLEQETILSPQLAQLTQSLQSPQPMQQMQPVSLPVVPPQPAPYVPYAQQPVYYQQPIYPQPMYQQPMMLQQPPMAAMAMHMQAQAMAMQSQASAMMMQAQQSAFYQPYGSYMPYGQPVMQQPAYPTMYNTGIIASSDMQKLTSQEKMQKLTNYLSQIIQSGTNDIHRLLLLLDAELEIIEHLLASSSGQMVDKLVLERMQLMRQSSPLITAAYDLVIDIASTSSDEGSDTRLYHYFVRKGKKTAQQATAGCGRKKFLTRMMTVLQEEYQMIENMQRISIPHR